jgi:hypothetical protein
MIYLILTDMRGSGFFDALALQYFFLSSMKMAKILLPLIAMVPA